MINMLRPTITLTHTLGMLTRLNDNQCHVGSNNMCNKILLLPCAHVLQYVHKCLGKRWFSKDVHINNY